MTDSERQQNIDEARIKIAALKREMRRHNRDVLKDHVHPNIEGAAQSLKNTVKNLCEWLGRLITILEIPCKDRDDLLIQLKKFRGEISKNQQKLKDDLPALLKMEP